jgi:hypothetical protein
MKRVALTIVATITGLVVLLQFKTQPAGVGRPAALAPQTPSSPGDSATPNPVATTKHRHSGRPRSTASAAPTGSAVGQTVTTRYGPVQVKVTVVSGRITDVAALQQSLQSALDNLHA